MVALGLNGHRLMPGRRRFGVFDTKQQLRDFARLPDYLRDHLLTVWARGVTTPGGYRKRFFRSQIAETKRLVTKAAVRPDKPVPLDEEHASAIWEIGQESRRWKRTVGVGMPDILPRDLSTRVVETEKVFEDLAEKHAPHLANSPQARRKFGRRCFATVIAEVYGKNP